MFEKSLQVLRLQRGADMEEVRKAYIKLTRRYPPEHFPEKFKEIKRAYEQLSLKWSALEPLVKDMGMSESKAQLMQTIMQEALQVAESKQEGKDSGMMDAWDLVPVLHSRQYTDELMSVLEEISGQGLEYADPDNTHTPVH